MIIVIAGSRNKYLNSLPPNLQGIEQVANLKILGLTISNKSSVDAVSMSRKLSVDVRSRFMPLRNQGMKVNALQLVFKSVLLGKMIYVVSAFLVGLRHGC